MEPEKQVSDHRIALTGWQTQVVTADEIRMCVPTKDCVRFWVTTVACFVAIGIGIFFMCWKGPQSPYFFIGEALLALAIGVLVPGPSIESMKKKPAVEIRPNPAYGAELELHSPSQ